MRNVIYLSPSGIECWRKDKEEYYLRYLAESRPPRDPQTIPMAIGSAFDSYVKSYISERVFGKGVRVEFDIDSIFEKAVEPARRDQARIDGLHVFELYKNSGALADLMTQLAAASDIKMEFEVQGTVLIQREGGVTLLGKPDLSFVSKTGREILLDWKVNGAYSSYTTSPLKGYTRYRDEYGTGVGPHKDAVLNVVDGIKYNSATTLDKLQISWAQQLSIYAWLCGQPVGGQFLVAIDQIVGQLGGRQRVAEHRLFIDSEYQHNLAREIDEIWEIIHSEWIFRDYNLEDSKGRCELLDQRAFSMFGASQEENELWSENSGRPRPY